MLEHLPHGVPDVLESGGRRVDPGEAPLRIVTAEGHVTVLRYWTTGFALAAEQAIALPGHVDLYRGPHHIARCLITAIATEAGETVYEFKRSTPAADGPPRDFAPDDPDAGTDSVRG